MAEHGESDGSAGRQFDPGTREDRSELFDHLVEVTMERDAYASLAEHPTHSEHPAGVDVVAEMEQYREELLQATSDEEFWFALRKISNVRRDRHLGVSAVEGGVDPAGARVDRAELPLRFSVDYRDRDDRFFFVSELGKRVGELVDGPVPGLGDRLVAVGERTVNEFVEALRPYKRYSTEDSFWWMAADEITRTWDPYYGHSHHLPPAEFYGDDVGSLGLGLERRDGTTYRVEVPYLEPETVAWDERDERRYPGFSRVPALDGYETYRGVYRPDDELPVVLLDWYGFGDDLPGAIDALMDYAARNEILDHHVVVDATRARGGSRGSYALRRLQPEPHRGTFGNLKLSDAMETWVEERVEDIRSGEADTKTVDDGSWQLAWLEEDVQRAIADEQQYTNDVPHKLAHAPKWSDGVIEPAPTHFRGELTVWVSPHGGSHLDQFAAQVVDNDLGHLMGMPAGGYSSTWEWKETIRFPTTNEPVVEYGWTMGHTLRPNKEVLQYNPAEPHEYVPQTRENYFEYRAELLRRTLERLGLT